MLLKPSIIYLCNMYLKSAQVFFENVKKRGIAVKKMWTH
jgi:hypothetical protein